MLTAQQGQHQHHGDGGRGPGQQTPEGKCGVQPGLGPGPGHQQAQSLQCRLRQDWLRLEDEVKKRTESGLEKPLAFE